MKLHRLLDGSRFRVIRKRYLDLNARRREALRTPDGQTPARYRGFMETSLQLAGMALVLELGDETVQADLDEAVAAARGWLNAPSEDWHIGVFSMALDTLAGFGPPEAAREAAGAQEDWYRTTEVGAEEAYFADVRGRKCWLRGDDAGARKACSEAASTARQPLFRSTSNALLALIGRRPAEFHAALGETVKAHKRLFTREPERADGVFTLEGLGLCRMARTYGIGVTDDTYLPVRFLAPGLLRD